MNNVTFSYFKHIKLLIDSAEKFVKYYDTNYTGIEIETLAEPHKSMYESAKRFLDNVSRETTA